MTSGFRYAISAIALALASAGTAQAATIIYTFSGVGSGDLDGSAFTRADFTVTLTADTDNVTSGGGQLQNIASSAKFQSGALAASLFGVNRVNLNTDPGFPIIIFGQEQPSPTFFVAEGLGNAAFPAYDLASDFALTSGDVSFIPQTFFTSVGNLNFSSITSMSFQAAVAAPPTSGVPEPATWALMLVGLGAVGATMRRPKQTARLRFSYS